MPRNSAPENDSQFDTPSPVEEELQGIEALQVSEPTLVDEYSGQGGSYTLDTSTGLRVLVQRTLPPNPAQ